MSDVQQDLSPAAQGWIKVANDRDVSIAVIIEPLKIGREIEPGDECYIRIEPEAGTAITVRLIDDCVVVYGGTSINHHGRQGYDYAEWEEALTYDDEDVPKIVAGGHIAQPLQSPSERVKELARTGRTVDAIKEYRQDNPTAGLREAKDRVEAIGQSESGRTTVAADATAPYPGTASQG